MSMPKKTISLVKKRLENSLILDEEDVDLKPLLKDEKKLKSLEGITRKSESDEKTDEKLSKAAKIEE